VASPLDILRKPITIHRRGMKRNVMSWKGTKLIPEAGFIPGSLAAPSMPGLPYVESERKLYCTTRDAAKGPGSACVPYVKLFEVN
jgi:hypothetical protein